MALHGEWVDGELNAPPTPADEQRARQTVDQMVRFVPRLYRQGRPGARDEVAWHGEAREEITSHLRRDPATPTMALFQVVGKCAKPDHIIDAVVRTDRLPTCDHTVNGCRAGYHLHVRHREDDIMNRLREIPLCRSPAVER